MRIATTIFLTDETIRPVRIARELEQRGFAGRWVRLLGLRGLSLCRVPLP